MPKINEMGRFAAFAGSGLLAFVSLIGLFWSVWMLIPLAFFAGLTVLGILDVTQNSHSILRNYPVLGLYAVSVRGYSPRNPPVPD
jgi:hypothetical protein